MYACTTLENPKKLRKEATPMGSTDKIKYVLNGKTHYYTLDELWHYLTDYYERNGVTFTEEHFRKKVRVLHEHDGDPYGDQYEEKRQLFHMLEERGEMYSIN